MDTWKEKLGDFVVGLVSPTKAALRKHWRNVDRDDGYRTAYEIALRVRGYKAAENSKNSTPWLNESNRSADGEIVSDLPRMRNRSRALDRDDSVASGITETFKRAVVGTGLRPQACTGDDAKDDALESVWAARRDKLSPGDGNLAHGIHQRLVYGSKISDGESFLRPAVASPGEPLWIETIESERVCTPMDAKPEDLKGRIVDGVEKDRFGRVVAYFILKTHPGEVIGAKTKLGSQAARVSPYSVTSFDRVLEPSVCHDRSKVTRSGQTRGVPLRHAILTDLRDIDLLIVASLKKAQVSACLSAFLTSDADASDLIELTAEDYGYQLDQRLEPGMIFRLFPGEKAEFLNPTAGGPDFDKFIWLLARRAGAAVGLSPQAILKAWDFGSYSAHRTIKNDDRQTFRVERADFSVTTLNWEWRLVMEDELLRGNETLLAAGVTVTDLTSDCVEWIGDEEPYVDPVAESQSIQMQLAMGLTSPQIECARLGRDYETVLRQKLKAELMEKELREEMGLPEAVSQEVAAGLKFVPEKQEDEPKEEAA